MVSVTLFGRVQVRACDGRIVKLPKKTLELLVFLLIQPEQQFTREQLACMLWDESNEIVSKKYLRQSLWQLQHTLSPRRSSRCPLVLTDNEWVSLNPSAELWIDARQLQGVFDEIARKFHEAMTPCQVESVKAVISLYQGELLRGWYLDWCLVERERYQSMYFVLVERLIDECITQKLFVEGHRLALSLLRAEPSREKTHQRLMRILFLMDDRIGAIRQFERCSEVLRSELGIGPSSATISLYETIRLAQSDERSETSEMAPMSKNTEMKEPFNTLFSKVTLLSQTVASLQTDMEQIKRVLSQKNRLDTDVRRLRKPNSSGSRGRRR